MRSGIRVFAKLDECDDTDEGGRDVSGERNQASHQINNDVRVKEISL